MRVHLVHGIRTQIGCPTVAALTTFFVDAGATVFYPDYGYELGLETRLVNPFIVNTLLPYIQKGDIWVGHSNGCALGFEIMKHSAPLGGAVFINAALEQDIALPAQIPWLDVYFNAGDTITEAAEVAQRLGLVDLHYGDMGHAGYRGKDPRVTNIDCGARPNMPPVSGHSDLFTLGKIQAWGAFIVKQIQAHPAL
jgi:hypothetical protein